MSINVAAPTVSIDSDFAVKISWVSISITTNSLPLASAPPVIPPVPVGTPPPSPPPSPPETPTAPLGTPPPSLPPSPPDTPTVSAQQTRAITRVQALQRGKSSRFQTDAVRAANANLDPAVAAISAVKPPLPSSEAEAAAASTEGSAASVGKEGGVSSTQAEGVTIPMLDIARTAENEAAATHIQRLERGRSGRMLMLEQRKAASEAAASEAPAGPRGGRRASIADSSRRSTLELLDEALRALPFDSDEGTIRAAVERFDFDALGYDGNERDEVVHLVTKLGALTLKQRGEEEGRNKPSRGARTSVVSRVGGAGPATPHGGGSAAPSGPPRAVASGGTPRKATEGGAAAAAAASGTPRAAGGSGSTPRKAGSPAAPRRAGGGEAAEKKPARGGLKPRTGLDVTKAAASDGGGVSHRGGQGQASQPERPNPRRASVAPLPSTTAKDLWTKITSRTDEYYVVAEELLPVYERVMKALLRDADLSPDLLVLEPLLDPISVHRKALDEYAGRFPDDPDPEALPEACVSDVVRARIVCTSGEQLIQLIGRLHKGFSHEHQGISASIELVRVQNNFAKLTPTHFRNIQCNVRLTHEGKTAFCELQLHHARISSYHVDNQSDDHFEFFRQRLGKHGGSEHINATLERVLLFLMEAAGVPVLLSLLVLVFSSAGEDENLDLLPQSAYELYSMATQSAVHKRLLDVAAKGDDGATAGAASGAAGGAVAAAQGERVRPARMKNKSNQGGVADWRVGASAKSADDTLQQSYDLTPEETYEVYARAHKVFDLLGQGSFGLSELKQKYVPKGSKITEPIIKILEKHVTGKRQTPEELQEVGLNMLRLVAVENQTHGRREFSSVHVASALASGGDTELALWLRMDCEEAGVTLIKTLESHTDTAPAMYQYKHLSFQEGLFARNLLDLVDTNKWNGWADDAAAAEFLNNAYMNNVCRIAAGELGRRLAQARSEWSFSEHKLSWVGKSALWQLVNENPALVRLAIPGNGVGPGGSGGAISESLTDGTGLARLFSTCPKLETIDLGFNKLGAFDKKQIGGWARALVGNASLLELDLQSNALGPEGVSMVCRALTTCIVVRTVNLSRNQPGRDPQALIQLVREHRTLSSLAVVEDDDKHLPSKVKVRLGEAILKNPAHQLAYVSCDAFELQPTTRMLKVASGKGSADVAFLAGVLRSNTTLTHLDVSGADVNEADRVGLGNALLDNPNGVVGFCDEFDLTPGCTDLDLDLKEHAASRKGPPLLFGLLRANSSLKRATLRSIVVDHVDLLMRAMRGNHTIEVLTLEYYLQTNKGDKVARSISLPLQQVTGHTPTSALDLSDAGELGRVTCAALGALLSSNTQLTSLKLSNTRLGDDAGGVLEHLRGMCREGGALCHLDLSSIGLTDKGARKLFDAMMTGDYPSLTSLALAGNQMKDPKVNGLIDMLHMDDCSLTALDLSANPLSGSLVMRALRLNRSLTSLNVCATELDDEGVRALGEMLLSTDFPCPLKLLACDYFQILDKKESLSFSGEKLSSASLTLLSGILKLNDSVHSLNLVGVGVDAAAAKSLETALMTNTTLEKLDLRDNDKLWTYVMGIDGDGAADGLMALARGLNANSTVASVFVDAMQLSIPKLKGTTPVTSLDFSAQKPLGGISAALIGLLVAHNPVVEKLDFSRNPKIRRLGFSIGAVLSSNVSLTELCVRESALGDEGTIALLDGLLAAGRGKSKISFLDLSANGIGPASASRFASLIKVSESALARLDLGSNGLGAQGTGVIAAALAGNRTLKALSLAQNELEPAGAEALMSALRVNSALTALWLGGNRLSNEGVTSIVDALLESGDRTSVAQLDLQDNKIGAAGIKSVVRLLSRAESLSALSIAMTKLEFTDTDTLQAAAKGEEIGRAKAVRLWMGKDTKNFPTL